jgi:hypothetical protein
MVYDIDDGTLSFRNLELQHFWRYFWQRIIQLLFLVYILCEGEHSLTSAELIIRSLEKVSLAWVFKMCVLASKSAVGHCNSTVSGAKFACYTTLKNSSKCSCASCTTSVP